MAKDVENLFAIQVKAGADKYLKLGEQGSGVYYARTLQSAIRLAKTAVICMTESFVKENLSTNMVIRIGRPDFAVLDRWSEARYWRNKKSCVCSYIKFTLEGGEIKEIESMIPMSPKMLRVLNRIANTFKA